MFIISRFLTLENFKQMWMYTHWTLFDLLLKAQFSKGKFTTENTRSIENISRTTANGETKWKIREWVIAVDSCMTNIFRTENQICSCCVFLFGMRERVGTVAYRSYISSIAILSFWEIFPIILLANLSFQT